MSTEVTALVSHPARLSPLTGFPSGCFSPPCPAPFLANQNHQLPAGHTLLDHTIHSRPGTPNRRQSKSNRHSNPSSPVSNSNPGLGPPRSEEHTSELQSLR